MNKNYKNGRAREYRIIKKLEKEGWLCIRSAGSHSPIDIIAMMPFKKYQELLKKKIKINLSEAYEETDKISIIGPNKPLPARFDEELETVVRFIQSKKTGYLTPQERAEKEELEQRFNIIIEVI